MIPSHADSENALERATVQRFVSTGYEAANLYHETFGENNSHGRETSSEVVGRLPRIRPSASPATSVPVPIFGWVSKRNMI